MTTAIARFRSPLPALGADIRWMVAPTGLRLPCRLIEVLIASRLPELPAFGGLRAFPPY